ncbi:MAG: hypothetical protein Q7O66_17475 [Dehalococcoidia bacterium]|nr:hypothetical protein [Dehalococcoidia bacterium]
MATDTSFGYVSKFEDFLVTAIADLPEIDTLAVAATAVTEIKALGIDGRLDVGVDTSNDDDNAGVSFGKLNWRSGVNNLKMEARIFIDSITDNKFFVGFGDSLASADETSFSATTDTVTIDTMSDAIGILFDNDATTKVLWCVAGKTDSVTANKALSSKYNPVAAQALTLGVFLSADCKSAVWTVNGDEVYRLDSDTTLVAATDLVPMVQNFEQATANIISVDYLYGRKDRSTT